MESHETLIRRMRLFKRNVICPSEMWLPLCENLDPAEVGGFLDTLDADLQGLILEEYCGEAHYRFLPSWYGQHPMQLQAAILAIGEWCEERLKS